MSRVEKRCLNCTRFAPDDLDRNRKPMKDGDFASWGDCYKTEKRMKDSWSCGEWMPKLREARDHATN